MQEPVQLEHIVTPQENRSDNSSRFLKISIIAASTILVLLGIYYLFSSYWSQKQEESKKISTDQELDLSKKSIVKNPDGNLNQYSKEINTRKLEVFNYFIDSMKDKSVFLEEANFSYTISGKVSKVEDLQENRNGTVITKRITLTFPNTQNLEFGFTDEDLVRTTVYLVTDINAKKVDFSSIKAGNIVFIEVKGNLLDDKPKSFLIRIVEKK